MIPTELEQENFRSAEGLVCLAAIIVLMAVLVLATIWQLYRTPAGAVQAAAQTEARP